MSEKNFTNATGNWIVSNTGEISYVGEVTITGELLAAKPDAASGAFSAGPSAGRDDQGQKATALGYYAGNSDQGQYGVAVGNQAGRVSQSEGGVAIGDSAGNSGQGFRSVAIGYRAGRSSQSTKSIAIGNSAGENSQRSYSIAIGLNAGQTNQGSSGIIISSGSSAVNNTNLGHIVLSSPNGSLTFNGTGNWEFAGGPVQASDYLDADGNSIIGGDANDYGYWQIQADSGTPLRVNSKEFVNFEGSGGISVSRSGSYITIDGSGIDPGGDDYLWWRFAIDSFNTTNVLSQQTVDFRSGDNITLTKGTAGQNHTITFSADLSNYYTASESNNRYQPIGNYPQSTTVSTFVTLNQSQYDSLPVKDSSTIYFIQE